MAKTKKFKKVVREYELPVKVEPLTEGGYLAYCDKLQGCMAEGETISEALQYMMGMAEIALDYYEEMNLPIPLKSKREIKLKSEFKKDKVLAEKFARPLQFQVPLYYCVNA